MKAVHPKVRLLSHTPAPQSLLCAAAKLCYASETEGLFEQDPAAGEFVRMLRRAGQRALEVVGKVPDVRPPERSGRDRGSLPFYAILQARGTAINHSKRR